MKRTTALIALCLLGGCATAPTYPPSHHESRTPSGMNRTTVTRKDGGRVKETVEPIEVARRPSSPGVYAGTWDAPEANAAPAESSLSFQGADESRSFSLSVGAEAGYQQLHLWHKLTTSFDSPSFSRIRWDHQPDLRGSGAGASVFLGRPQTFGLLVGLSYFQDEHQANAQTENGYFAQESVYTQGMLMNLEGRFYPARWVFGSLGAGLLEYQARTQIETNAPDFTYAGLEGARVVGALGFGAGLETPWEFPVHLFAAGHFYLPLSSEAPSLESGIGQTTVGVTVHF